MDNYIASFAESEGYIEEKDEGYMNSLISGDILIHNDENLLCAKYVFDLTDLGDFYENKNITNENKKKIFNNFAQLLDTNEDGKIGFKQSNGNIDIVKKQNIMTFTLSHMAFESSFSLKINDSVKNTFKKIAEYCN